MYFPLIEEYTLFLYKNYFMKKKRLFESQELTQLLGKKFGFEDKLLALEIRNWLIDHLGTYVTNDLECTTIRDGIIEFKVKSPILAQELRMREAFLLMKIQEILSNRTNIQGISIFLTNRPTK